VLRVPPCSPFAIASPRDVRAANSSMPVNTSASVDGSGIGRESGRPGIYAFAAHESNLSCPADGNGSISSGYLFAHSNPDVLQQILSMLA